MHLALDRTGSGLTGIMHKCSHEQWRHVSTVHHSGDLRSSTLKAAQCCFELPAFVMQE
jgi:hypothetical protein